MRRLHIAGEIGANAWHDCEALRAKFPQATIGYSLGAAALCELGLYAHADNLLRLGLKQKPNEEELLEKYAWIAQLSENPREARRRWGKLKNSYPNNHAAGEVLEAVFRLTLRLCPI